MRMFHGTIRHMFSFALASCLLSCGTDHESSDDDTPLDISDPANQKACARRQSAYVAFVDAHRACEQDDDCVLLGSCSDSAFDAVNADGAEEAMHKRAGLCDHAFDGPVYDPVCRAKRCALVKIENACCGCPNPDAGF